MIVCLRTVAVPTEWRDRYLAWIEEGRATREQHGILAELVIEATSADADTVVITVWPSHEVFDAWIETPERDALTASEVNQAVDYRPIRRYEVVGGYLNLPGLAISDPSANATGAFLLPSVTNRESPIDEQRRLLAGEHRVPVAHLACAADHRGLRFEWWSDGACE